MRAVALAALAACSPNTAVPDGGRHIDAPPGPVDARADAIPDTDLPPGLLPDPPDPGTFMWPSLQEHFHRDGMPCTGQVTLAVGDQVVCYVGSDDDVHCAGAVYTHAWGPMFTPIGQTGVDQIVISPTVGTATGNSMCVHERAGTVWCMGDGNSNGTFGDGTTSPSATFVQFGSSSSLAKMGSNMDVRCVLDTGGTIDCAGYGLLSTPSPQTGPGHHSFWTRIDGQLIVDDPMVFRQANGSRCVIQPVGATCGELVQTANGVGPPGAVVDAFVSHGTRACWLEANGTGHCTDFDTTWQVFASAPPLVALAGNYYTDSRCAVGNDGSLWCIGTNMHGELGTGTTSPVLVETRVAPPGSVKLTCG